MKKVLGIGNALVDVLIRLESDAMLSELMLEKGSMTLVDKERVNSILHRTAHLDRRKSSGGSAANAVNGLARLGVPAGYIGKINEDDYGAFFRSDMEKNRVKTHMFHGLEETGKCVVLISPDCERTFATYLGAAVELEKSDLSPPLFEGYDYFLLEGYLVQNTEMLETAAAFARQAGLQIAIDLASFNMVESFKSFLHRIVEEYVDIVFANEDESRVFTDRQDPEAAVKEIAGKGRIGVVKCGADGSLIMSDGVINHVKPVRAEVKDTTGAGDLYAAGFFYGLVNGYPLDICGRIGSVIGGRVVQIIGARMDEPCWVEIEKQIREIEEGL